MIELKDPFSGTLMGGNSASTALSIVNCLYCMALRGPVHTHSKNAGTHDLAALLVPSQ